MSVPAMRVLYLAGTPMWAHIYGVLNGMRALGLDVVTVGTPVGNAFHRSIMEALARHEPGFGHDVLAEPDEPIDAILARAGARPDLILYMENGAAFLPAGLAEVPIPTVGVLTEDFAHADWEPDLFPWFDVALSAVQESVDRYRDRGHDNVDYWYLGGVDRYHRDHGVARVHDVSLIGGLSVLHRERARTFARIRALQAEGMRVLQGYGAYFDDYARLYSASKIAFNRSACDQFNMRVLEAAACGALVVTNRPRNSRDASSWFLIEGKHVVYYDTDDEAVALVRHYLAHEDERARIAETAREYVTTYHGYPDVAMDLFARIVAEIPPDFLERRRARLAARGQDPRRQRAVSAKHFYLRGAVEPARRGWDALVGDEADGAAYLGAGLTAALAGDVAAARPLLRRAAGEPQTATDAALARAGLAAVLFHDRAHGRTGEIGAACLLARESMQAAPDEPATLERWLYFPPVYDRFRMELSLACWTLDDPAARFERLRALVVAQLARMLGVLALEAGDGPAAIAHLEAAAAVVPDDAELRVALARARLEAGDRAGAAAELTAAAAADPLNEEIAAAVRTLPPATATPSRAGITAIVHTLNEEAKLEDALRSLRGWVDEILVCDMHSDDATVEIARRYTDRVITHERIRDFDAARNASAAEATHEWVLYLDADERIGPALAAEITRLLPTLGTDVAAVALPMDDRWMGRQVPMWQRGARYKSPQLLRRGRFHFPGAVHVGPVVDGRVVCVPPAAGMAITHYAWDGLAHWMTKINRYTDAEAAKLDAAGARFDWRAAVRGFVEGLAADGGGRFADALELVIAMNGANYRFYQHAKLHERHLAAGALAPGEQAGPRDVVEFLEHALGVARERASAGAGSGSSPESRPHTSRDLTCSRSLASAPHEAARTPRLSGPLPDPAPAPAGRVDGQTAQQDPDGAGPRDREASISAASGVGSPHAAAPGAAAHSGVVATGQRFSLYHSEGNEGSLKAWMAPYAELFRGRRRVLDVGCGPGVFLELLRERGVEGEGLDTDPDMVAACRAKGFVASVGTAEALRATPGAYDGIHLGHIIEHMTGDAAVALLEQCTQALAPGGLLLVRTPNWANEQVRMGGFWLDHTHVRPYPLPLLERIFLDLGLEIAQQGHEPYGWEDAYIVGRKPAATPASAPRVASPTPTTSAPPSPEAGAASLAPDVVWQGAVFCHHSLANVNRAVCVELVRAGLDIGIDHVEAPTFGAAQEPALQGLATRVGRTAPGAAVRVRHQFPPDFSRPSEDKLVVMVPWEFGPAPVDWVDGMRVNADEVWVYSRYNKDAYVASGVPPERIHVIPLGVDTAIYHPAAAARPIPTAKSFKFLYVGGSITRKGFDVLLQAYAEEFTATDDVCLVFKDQAFYKPGLAGALDALRARPSAPEVVYCVDDMLPSQMPGFYRAADCLVQPFRGEGFGLPILEAMACGLPVIVTDHGPVREFCPDDAGWFIPCRLVPFAEPRVDHLPTVAPPVWAEPDVAGLRRLMRHAFEHREEGRARGRRGAAHARGFTWAHTARRCAERIAALAAAPPSERGIETLLREGAQLLEADRVQEATPVFLQAARLEPGNVVALTALAHCALALGETEMARDLLREIVKLAPDHEDARRCLALVEEAAGAAVP